MGKYTTAFIIAVVFIVAAMMFVPRVRSKAAGLWSRKKKVGKRHKGVPANTVLTQSCSE